MKISYLVTCHNEAVQLRSLLYIISIFKAVDDEVVILDDFSDDEYTQGVLLEYEKNGMFVYKRALNNNYGEHKNIGTQQCRGDWIFQIDGDEMPPDSLLGDNLKAIIQSNPDTELFWVPRMNNFKGVTEEHAKQWGWSLSESPSLKVPLVSWPDWQGRIYKNDYPRIRWERKLHERIEGYVRYSFLPTSEEFALHHQKTIEKQVETNVRYNNDFTRDENQGISNRRQG